MSYNWNVNANIATRPADVEADDMQTFEKRDISLGEAIYTVMVEVPPSLWDRMSIIYGYNREMNITEVQSAYYSADFPQDAVAEAA